MGNAKRKAKRHSAGLVRSWEWALCLTLVVLSVWLKPLYMFFTNAEEAAFREILPLMGGYAAGALAVFLFTALLSRSAWGAAVVAAAAAIAATNFTAFERVCGLLPLHIRYWHAVAALVFILAHLAYLFTKKLPAELVRIAGCVLTLVFGVLVAINGAVAAPVLVRRAAPDPAGTAESIAFDPAVAQYAGKMPNVYYFVFDEFSSRDVMEKYYDYSGDFFDQLEDLGFTVSYDSRNMSIYTATVTTNYLHYDYVVTDDNTAQEKLDAKADNPTRGLFESHGYACRSLLCNQTVMDWGMGVNLARAGVTSATTMGGKSLDDLLLESSILYPAIDDMKAGEQLADIIDQAFSFFEGTSWRLPSNTYTVVYAATPHEPFIFDADGTLNNPRYFYDWDDPQYYAHQWEYVASRMLKTVKTIVAGDPTAIIILQSDHGARHTPGIEYDEKTNIFNAVYFGGSPIEEIRGKSGVNTLRTVYGKLLSIDLPEVEVHE